MAHICIIFLTFTTFIYNSILILGLVCDKYSYSHSYSNNCPNNRIRIHIRPFLLTRIYSYSYSSKNLDPNIFIFVFAIKSQPEYIRIRIRTLKLYSSHTGRVDENYLIFLVLLFSFYIDLNII